MNTNKKLEHTEDNWAIALKQKIEARPARKKRLCIPKWISVAKKKPKWISFLKKLK